MSALQRGFKLLEPHNPDVTYHEWFFPNGWRGIGPIEKRDRRGYLVGKRRIYAPDWFVLACNNMKCDARAVVPVRIMEDHANRLDPEVEERPR